MFRLMQCNRQWRGAGVLSVGFGILCCAVQDGHKQDALDLISGAFKVGKMS